MRTYTFFCFGRIRKVPGVTANVKNMYAELQAKQINSECNSGGDKVNQQQLIRWWWWWCALQYISRNTNETPVQSGSISSDSAFEDNLIDGRGLSRLIQVQHSSIAFPFQSVFLVKMLIQKKEFKWLLQKLSALVMILFATLVVP